MASIYFSCLFLKSDTWKDYIPAKRLQLIEMIRNINHTQKLLPVESKKKKGLDDFHLPLCFMCCNNNQMDT